MQSQTLSIQNRMLVGSPTLKGMHDLTQAGVCSRQGDSSANATGQ